MNQPLAANGLTAISSCMEGKMRNLVRFTGILTVVTVVMAIGNEQVIAQQSFSCPYGKTASCLDYGDKVCSSYSKCVSQDAKCFDSYTCGYEGFICKSKYDDVVDEYNDLLRENQRLQGNPRSEGDAMTKALLTLAVARS